MFVFFLRAHKHSTVLRALAEGRRSFLRRRCREDCRSIVYQPHRDTFSQSHRLDWRADFDVANHSCCYFVSALILHKVLDSSNFSKALQTTSVPAAALVFSTTLNHRLHTKMDEVTDWLRAKLIFWSGRFGPVLGTGGEQ